MNVAEFIEVLKQLPATEDVLVPCTRYDGNDDYTTLEYPVVVVIENGSIVLACSPDIQVIKNEYGGLTLEELQAPKEKTFSDLLREMY